MECSQIDRVRQKTGRGHRRAGCSIDEKLVASLQQRGVCGAGSGAASCATGARPLDRNDSSVGRRHRNNQVYLRVSEENSMKQLRGKSFDSARTASVALAATRMVPERSALSNGTPGLDAAPTAGSAALCNGCISELSSNDIHGYSHDYAVAMKNYATIYENFQAYLEPANILASHDYDLSTRPVEEHEHLGCLDQEFIECATNVEAISDEDIERCGYLGWLRH
jgi:hypothetical protein